jgi:hypothetical protein
MEKKRKGEMGRNKRYTIEVWIVIGNSKPCFWTKKRCEKSKIYNG